MACSCRRQHSEYPHRSSCSHRPAYPYKPEYPNCNPYPPVDSGQCTGALAGGWSSFVRPTSAEIALFRQALSNVIGVMYEPLYVSRQVVSGTNYLFVARAITPGTTCTTNIVTVAIAQALNGTITLGTIQPIIA